MTLFFWGGGGNLDNFEPLNITFKCCLVGVFCHTLLRISHGHWASIFSMNFLSYINIMVRPSTTTTVWLSYACVFLLIVSCLFPYFDICINIISHISLASHNILVFLQTLTLSATSKNHTLIRVSFWLLQLFHYINNT